MQTITRIWIELPKPSNEEDAKLNVSEANRIMRKLGAKFDIFDWCQDKRSYIRYLPNHAGFLYLTDNGDWFNTKNIA